MGHPAHDRANAKRPVLSFRAPDQDFKERVKNEAKRHGLSVHDYLIEAVTAYMDGRPAPRVREALQTKLNEQKQELAKALDELSSQLPRDFE